MPGIIVMAILTILVTASLAFATLETLTHADRRCYWLVLIGLPASFLVNGLIEIPLITGIGTLAEIPLKLGSEMPLWFIALIWLTAPITEEAIKILPLAVPVSRAFLQDASHTLSAGFALGFGFGLGEAAYLAYGLARRPDYNQLPWFMFTGFALERLIVTFGHGFLTAVAAKGLSVGHKSFSGYLAAVGLHALINLGPILLALKLIFTALASIGSYAAILAAFLVFQKNIRAARKISSTPPNVITYFER